MSKWLHTFSITKKEEVVTKEHSENEREKKLLQKKRS